MNNREYIELLAELRGVDGPVWVDLDHRREPNLTFLSPIRRPGKAYFPDVAKMQHFSTPKGCHVWFDEMVSHCLDDVRAVDVVIGNRPRALANAVRGAVGLPQLEPVPYPPLDWD